MLLVNSESHGTPAFDDLQGRNTLESPLHDGRAALDGHARRVEIPDESVELHASVMRARCLPSLSSTGLASFATSSAVKVFLSVSGISHAPSVGEVFAG